MIEVDPTMRLLMDARTNLRALVDKWNAEAHQAAGELRPQEALACRARAEAYAHALEMLLPVPGSGAV